MNAFTILPTYLLCVFQVFCRIWKLFPSLSPLACFLAAVLILKGIGPQFPEPVLCTKPVLSKKTSSGQRLPTWKFCRMAGFPICRVPQHYGLSTIATEQCHRSGCAWHFSGAFGQVSSTPFADVANQARVSLCRGGSRCLVLWQVKTWMWK